MVIKNQWLQYVILVGLSVAFICLLVFVLGRWFRNNNFPKTKGSIWILLLFTVSLVFILANTAIDANKGIDLQSITQGVQEVLSTFVVPVVLGIMFTTSEYNKDNGAVNSRIEKETKNTKINLYFWRFESHKEITVVHNIDQNLNSSTDEELVKATSESVNKTKTVTTENIKTDSNGVKHYEKITTVTEEN